MLYEIDEMFSNCLHVCALNLISIENGALYEYDKIIATPGLIIVVALPAITMMMMRWI